MKYGYVHGDPHNLKKLLLEGVRSPPQFLKTFEGTKMTCILTIFRKSCIIRGSTAVQISTATDRDRGPRSSDRDRDQGRRGPRLKSRSSLQFFACRGRH